LSPLSSDEHPTEAAVDLLSQTEDFVLTGTTLSNHTRSELLSWGRPGGLVMVLSASTPLSLVLFELGSLILSGTNLVDEDVEFCIIVPGALFIQVEDERLLTLTHSSL